MAWTWSLIELDICSQSRRSGRQPSLPFWPFVFLRTPWPAGLIAPVSTVRIRNMTASACYQVRTVGAAARREAEVGDSFMRWPRTLTRIVVLVLGSAPVRAPQTWCFGVST